MNPRLIAVLQTLIIVVLGAFAGVLAKLSLTQVEPFTFVWLQIAIGGLLLTGYTFAWRRERIPSGLGWQIWLFIIWIGIANFAIVRVFFLFSLDRLPATTHIYLVNFVGILTMLMSIYMLRERPSIYQLFGALIAIAGLHLFFREIPAPKEMLGLIYVTVAVLALATTNNIARKLALISKGKVSNNIISTVALWIGGTPVVLFGLCTDLPPAVFGWRNWAIIALNGTVSIAIGLTVWNYILKTLRSYEASIVGGGASVIFTALFAIPILGESLSAHELWGIGAMFLGLILVQIRRA